MNSSAGGFTDFWNEVPLFFKIFAGFLIVVVVGGFLYVIIKGISIGIANNRAALLTKRCKIVDKRTEVWGGSGESSANTSYFITFEFEDRSRIELQVKPDQFGLIVAGDQGEVTYQGTRFKGFARKDSA
ncbi:DUF2500 domain-containing protein [Paenibacillus sp. DYY-L-2]|uniref:DUF2500 domain-containing protein n=1 Tax=Paenibacillus sp. DYY-L-2 TaxID=3447013 RepID=UPI003F4F7F2A